MFSAALSMLAAVVKIDGDVADVETLRCKPTTRTECHSRRLLLSALAKLRERPGDDSAPKGSLRDLVSSGLHGSLADAPLAIQVPRTFGRHREAATAVLEASDRDFNLARGHSRRLTPLGSHHQTFSNGVGDIDLSLGLRRTLADAPWDCWTLGDEGTVFVLLNADQKLHG